MKQNAVKFISALICLCLTLSVAAIIGASAAGTSSSPIIFYHNDRQWSLSSRKPVEADANGVYYAPLTAFAQLTDVKVRINNTLQTFIITYGDKYLSFDTATSYVANQDKERSPINIYQRSDEWYIPMESVCRQLGLTYEMLTSPLTGAVAVRISNRGAEYSFKTLLRRKNPGFFPENTDPPVVKPPVIEPPKLTERTVYITIEDGIGVYTEGILSVLRQYGCKATFFITGDSIVKNAATLSKILANGHEIGLLTMPLNSETPTSAENVIADIEAANELLYRVVKYKSRIWRAPEDSEDTPAVTDEVRDALSGAGYIIWDANVDIPKNTAYASTASNKVINGIRNNKVAVIRLHETKITASALRTVLAFINENRNACDVRTITPAFEEYRTAE